MPILEWLLPALILLGALVLALARRRGPGVGAAKTRAAAAPPSPREDPNPPRFLLSPRPGPEPLSPREAGPGPRTAASPLTRPAAGPGGTGVPSTRRRLRGLLRDRRGRRVAILAHEILRRPVGLGREQGRLPSDQPERR